MRTRALLPGTLLAWAALLALASPSCRPVPTGGLPADPGDVLASMRELARPAHLQLRGRCRTEIGKIPMSFGMQLTTDRDGNARVDLDYPFGGRALSLVLAADGRLVAESAVGEPVLYTADAGELVSRMVGEPSRATLLLDLLLGRLPTSFDGPVSWERLDRRSLLALQLTSGHRALCGVQRRPTRLDEMRLLNGDETVIATAQWSEWSEQGGYWLPGEVRLDVPGRIGELKVIVQEVVIDPEVTPELFAVHPAAGDAPSFETLLDGMR